MIRVLSVQHYPTFGGPYNELLLLTRPMHRRGVETVVVMTSEPGTAISRVRGLSEVHTMPLARIRMTPDPRLHIATATHFRRDVRNLRAVIRRERIDLVKVHGPHNPHGAIAAHLEGVPVVWVISSTRVPRAFRRFGVMLVRHYAASVLVNGKALFDAYPGADKLADRAFVYYPPVDTDIFHPVSLAERDEIRRELGIPPNAPLIGTIANINPQKGIQTFLQVARHVTDIFPDSRFLIAGATAPSQRSYDSRVRTEALRLGLGPDRISWLGERSDVALIVAALDVKVITSVPESEGTTTTAGEAMACGVPVVATPVGAIAEVVQHGSTGFVVDSHNPVSIAERVTQLLSDDDMRETMGVAARKRVISQFDVHECANVHLSAYRLALARSQ